MFAHVIFFNWTLYFCIAISRYLRFCETNEPGNMPRSGTPGRKRKKDLEKQGKLIIFAPFFKRLRQ